ncbi:MAG: universal stress protein [Dehalococcoidia bacterium]|nr:universal stress protein [Dehalococcoidia bacterium]
MATQHTILVPVTGTPASMEAVSVAALLAKQRKSKVIALHVIEVERSLPLNAELDAEARRGEQVLRRAEDLAASSGIHLTGELIQARNAGQAILDEAADRGIDTIIMGVGYKRMIGAVQMGRTAQLVLRNAYCQVWLVRQAFGQPGVRE